MDKDTLIQQLISTINQQRTDLLTVVGIFIAIIALGGGFIAWFQFKLSDKQIIKIKEDFKRDFKKEFREEFEIDELVEANNVAKKNISKMNESVESFKQIEKSSNYWLNISMNMNLTSSVQSLKDFDEDNEASEIMLKFYSFKDMYRFNKEKGALNDDTFSDVVFYFYIFISRFCTREIKIDKDSFDLLENFITILNNDKSKMLLKDRSAKIVNEYIKGINNEIKLVKKQVIK